MTGRCIPFSMNGQISSGGTVLVRHLAALPQLFSPRIARLLLGGEPPLTGEECLGGLVGGAWKPRSKSDTEPHPEACIGRVRRNAGCPVDVQMKFGREALAETHTDALPVLDALAGRLFIGKG